MRRKILMGVLALALPVGSLVGLQTAAVAKTPVPPDPGVTCSASGSVTFAAPGLSKLGTITTAKTSTTTAHSTFSGCGSSSPLSVNIVSKNTKCKGAGNPDAGCLVKKTLIDDTESSFASTTTITSLLKSLKKITFTVSGRTYSTKTTGAHAIACNDSGYPAGDTLESGFLITGEVKSPKQDKGQTTTLTACLGTDVDAGGSGYFFNDLGSGVGTIVSAGIDPSTSSLVISPA